MILVTGAAGKTGRAIIRALIDRGGAVRALVRRPEQTAQLQGLGANAVNVGDLNDTEALARAAAGARSIYHICPNVSPAEVTIGQKVIAAARHAGVEQIVYHSVLHPQIAAMPHHWDKLRVEELLLETKLDVTILQPTAYMQNLLMDWTGIAGGVYRFPYPARTAISLVDLRDVAEIAARVLTEPGHGGAIYELVGTPALEQIEVAATLSRALARPVQPEPGTVEAWEAQAKAAGISDTSRTRLAAMFRCYAAIGLIGNPNVLTWLLGRPPTTLFDFAQRVAAGSRD